GWGFGNGWRTELELSWRRADFDKASAGALVDATTDGHYSQASVFVNALYDFHSVQGPIRPYLGGGVGISRVSWNDAVSYVPGESV
ncbi:P44/Msp2 family outer membrane protein, partial [Pseudoalteromonas sp. SYSU M81241]